MIITLPQNLALQDWADQVVLDLDVYDVFPKLADADWQNWGTQFLNSLALGPYNLPNPYLFADWQEWADRFCGALA